VIKKLKSGKYLLNFVLVIVIGIAFLFGGLAISFVLLRLLPGDPVLCLLPPGPFTPAEYQMIAHLYGFDQPIFIQFLRYILDFFSGNWGNSCALAPGLPVNDILRTTIPRTIEVLSVPLLIGVALGFLFGRISNRTKHNWLKMGIQLLTALLLALPIIFVGLLFQLTLGYLVPLLPVTGYKSPAFSDPTFITGFRLLDSLISGRWDLLGDTLLHYILPGLILTVAITALMTRVFSSKMTEDAYKRNTILSNTAKTSAVFGIIFTYFILVDVIFNLYGFGSRFVTAFMMFDYFLLRAFIFVFIILYVIILIVSNLTFSIISLLKDKKQPLKVVEDAVEREPKTTIIIDLKNYSNKIIRSPITLIGLVAIIITIVVSIFAELISGYSFNGALGIYLGPWEPPSPDHPLGTANFGRDVLALILYGTGDALIFGIGAVIVGLIGGLIFGLLAQIHRVVRTIIMSFTLIFYVLPGILIVMFLVGSIGRLFGLLMIATGFLLIPSFSRIIANAEFKIVLIGKKVLAYIPLFIGFSILFYLSLGFLGYGDPYTIQLGALISVGRTHLYDAPWASLWPGFMAFLIVVSFFVLHEGLAKHSR